jgi:very-short-patch-repair endonuclease
LAEHHFVELFLNQKKTDLELREMGINRKLVLRTRKYWRSVNPTYNQLSLELHKHRLSLTSIGHKRGCHPPTTIVDRKKLEELLSLGWASMRIAKELGTTEFLINRNIQHHALHTPRLVRRHISTPFMVSQIDEIDKLCPGLRQALDNSPADKATFIRKSYSAFLKMLWLAHFLKETAGEMTVHAKTSDRTLRQISWSINFHEIAISLALEESNIPHIREFVFSGMKRVDFAIIGTNILVELDGAYHNYEEDKDRDALLTKMGYKVLRFKDSQAVYAPEKVLESIKEEIRLCQSPLKITWGSGTSRSKTITPT